MQLNFKSILEYGSPGLKFQKLFYSYWPTYHSMLISDGATYIPDLATSQAALKAYMPKMLPTYERLCNLVNADDQIARFLTGFQPPAHLNACSQAVISGKEIQLVRNYDYHPDLFEGTLLLSSWNGKKVIATTDYIMGLVDGMNEDGLVVSLTFGGRKVVGEGFGISFILRYVLEFCSNVQEAIEVLTHIPSHMSYNVTITDKSAAFKTILLSPDCLPVVTDVAYTTNHQLHIDWPENAAFNRTIERSVFLKKLLENKELSPDDLTEAFLYPPLYNNLFNEGFGTLYTSVYRPLEGTVQLHWPNEAIFQSFDNFSEESKSIQFKDQAAINIQKTDWIYLNK
jgi:predicted choloylglycine hydrolase